MRRFITEIISAAVFILLLVELFFRFVIPAPELPQKEQNNDFSIFRFSYPSNEGLFTYGRTAQIKARFNINRQGYVSTFDYLQNDSSIAFIGDSYVSSLYTDTENNIDQLVMDQTQLIMYNFGMSGGNMAEYSKYMDYAYLTFGCKKFIVLISNGDLIESYKKISSRKYERQINVIGDSIQVYESKKFKAGKIGSLLNKSALFRYAVTNISFSPSKQGNIVNLSNYTSQLSRLADYLVNEITKEYDVLFLVQGQQSFIYSNDTRSEENKVILESLNRNGANFIDLNPIFRTEYLQHQRKFEFKINDHWNKYGNQVVAQSIQDYLNKKEGQYYLNY